MLSHEDIIVKLIYVLLSAYIKLSPSASSSTAGYIYYFSRALFQVILCFSFRRYKIIVVRLDYGFKNMPFVYVKKLPILNRKGQHKPLYFSPNYSGSHLRMLIPQIPAYPQ